MNHVSAILYFLALVLVSSNSMADPDIHLPRFNMAVYANNFEIANTQMFLNCGNSGSAKLSHYFHASEYYTNVRYYDVAGANLKSLISQPVCRVTVNIFKDYSGRGAVAVDLLVNNRPQEDWNQQLNSIMLVCLTADEATGQISRTAECTSIKKGAAQNLSRGCKAQDVTWDSDGQSPAVRHAVCDGKLTAAAPGSSQMVQALTDEKAGGVGFATFQCKDGVWTIEQSRFGDGPNRSGYCED